MLLWQFSMRYESAIVNLLFVRVVLPMVRGMLRFEHVLWLGMGGRKALQKFCVSAPYKDALHRHHQRRLGQTATSRACNTTDIDQESSKIA